MDSSRGVLSGTMDRFKTVWPFFFRKIHSHMPSTFPFIVLTLILICSGVWSQVEPEDGLTSSTFRGDFLHRVLSHKVILLRWDIERTQALARRQWSLLLLSSMSIITFKFGIDVLLMLVWICFVVPN